MVGSITSFSRSGLKDWFLQRVTAVLLLIYALLLAWFFTQHHPVQYQDWVTFFSHPAIKIITFFAMFSIVIHAWIGMWTVYTDYIKCTAIRSTIQVITVLGLLTLLVWGVMILWG